MWYCVVMGRNISHNKLPLLHVCSTIKSFENNAEKGEIAHNEQFFPYSTVSSTLFYLFQQCFLP